MILLKNMGIITTGAKHCKKIIDWSTRCVIILPYHEKDTDHPVEYKAKKNARLPETHADCRWTQGLEEAQAEGASRTHGLAGFPLRWHLKSTPFSSLYRKKWFPWRFGATVWSGSCVRWWEKSRFSRIPAKPFFCVWTQCPKRLVCNASGPQWMRLSDEFGCDTCRAVCFFFF